MIDKFQNILYFLVIGSVSIFLIYLVLSWLKWLKSKKMEQNHSFQNFEIFENVLFETTFYGTLKVRNSMTLKSKVYINKDFIFILPQHFSLKIFKSRVPLKIDLSKYKFEIKPIYTQSAFFSIEQFPYYYSLLKVEIILKFSNSTERNKFILHHQS